MKERVDYRHSCLQGTNELTFRGIKFGLIIIKMLAYIITYIIQSFRMWKGVKGGGTEWKRVRRTRK